MANARQGQLQYAYRTLKQQILDLTLLPGEVLNTSRLAAGLGVSRTPVREALGMLERDGLVTRMDGGGYRVAKVTLTDVKEAFSVQAHLEVIAVHLAVERITDEEIAHLASILEAAGEAHRRGDLGQMNRLSMEFHSGVVEASGNRVLAGIHRNLLERLLHLSRISYLKPGRPEASHQEHLQILQALAARDAHAAEQAIRSHLKQATENLVELVSAGQAPVLLTWPQSRDGSRPGA